MRTMRHNSRSIITVIRAGLCPVSPVPAFAPCHPCRPLPTRVGLFVVLCSTVTGTRAGPCRTIFFWISKRVVRLGCKACDIFEFQSAASLATMYDMCDIAAGSYWRCMHAYSCTIYYTLYSRIYYIHDMATCIFFTTLLRAATGRTWIRARRPSMTRPCTSGAAPKNT